MSTWGGGYAPRDAVGDIVGGQRLGDARVDRGGLLRVAAETVDRELSVCTIPGAISVTRTGCPLSSSRSVSRGRGGVLGCGVATTALVDDPAGRRADHDDVPAPALDQRGQQRLRHAQRAEDVDLVHPRQSAIGRRDRLHAERATGVVDQHVAVGHRGRERRHRVRPRSRRASTAADRRARSAAAVEPVHAAPPRPRRSPRAASRRAVAAPIPLLAPVTTAVRCHGRHPASLPRTSARVGRGDGRECGMRLGRWSPSGGEGSRDAATDATPRRRWRCSVHTSPLDQPGTGDAGGMNVYVVEVARRLAARGVEVEIFTRATAQRPAAGRRAGPRRAPSGTSRPARSRGWPRRTCPASCARSPPACCGPRRARPGLLRPRPLALLAVRPGRLAGQGALGRAAGAHRCTPWPRSRTAAGRGRRSPSRRPRVIGEEQVVAAADRLDRQHRRRRRASSIELYGADPRRSRRRPRRRPRRLPPGRRRRGPAPARPARGRARPAVRRPDPAAQGARRAAARRRRAARARSRAARAAGRRGASAGRAGSGLASPTHCRAGRRARDRATACGSCRRRRRTSWPTGTAPPTSRRALLQRVVRAGRAGVTGVRHAGRRGRRRRAAHGGR